MSEVDPPEVLKPKPHGLAIREDYAGEVEHASLHPYHVATYDCKCGKVGYRIFVNETHYDLGGRFQRYVAQVLEDLHTHNEKHPDVIQIPMDAEFPT
jgi:hypothetical protein